MKESLQLGSERQPAASLLRAFGGGPKCLPLGPNGQQFDFEIQYLNNKGPFQNGIVELVGTFPNGVPVAWNLPGAKWVVTVSATVTKTIPGLGSVLGPAESAFSSTIKLSAVESVNPAPSVINPFGGGNIINPNVADDPLYYLVNTANFWSLFPQGIPPYGTLNQQFPNQFPTNVQVGQFFINKTAAAVGNSAVEADSGNPELFSLLDVDLSVPGSLSKTTILAEQVEFCYQRFLPWVRTTNTPAAGLFSGFPTEGWFSTFPNFNVLPGVFLGLTTPNLFPDAGNNNVVLGTISFNFQRVSTIPLFKTTLFPPLGVLIQNLTLFNPAVVTSWLWDFGDGQTSNAVSPNHTYAHPGTYDIVLTVTDPVGAHKFDQVITIPFKAAFNIRDLGIGQGSSQHRYTITDQSLGAASWDWNFGDGTPDYTQQEPPNPYAFTKGHQYTITLKIGDGAGNFDTASQTINA